LHQTEPNASLARNVGALAATGDVLLFLDDDIRSEQILSPLMLEIMLITRLSRLQDKFWKAVGVSSWMIYDQQLQARGSVGFISLRIMAGAVIHNGWHLATFPFKKRCSFLSAGWMRTTAMVLLEQRRILGSAFSAPVTALYLTLKLPFITSV